MDASHLSLPPYAQFLSYANHLGFSHVGVLSPPADCLSLEGDNLNAWLSQGYHADMQWMVENLDKRLNPLALMPGTQSIVCVAMNYHNPRSQNNADEPKIAQYALGDDYHDVVKKRLKELLAWLKTWDAAIEGRALTDSAPILEKALALKAGIGWQGKHSNVITQSHGSWVFLGELLLNITFPDAPAPEPFKNLCGTCTRCITACPTQAIVEPGIVDAGQCISYWTIESKADTIPEPIAAHLNGWLFGCDICQDVCPWNIKFAQPSKESAFVPRPWNTEPRLDEIMDLTDSQFKIRYRKSPVKRAKLKGLQRNATALLKYAKNTTARQP